MNGRQARGRMHARLALILIRAAQPRAVVLRGGLRAHYPLPFLPARRHARLLRGYLHGCGYGMTYGMTEAS